jgi:hypothetical protein
LKVPNEDFQLKELIIVFAKAPALGKVKTRLAKAIGQQKALSVYKKLIGHTFDILQKVPQQKLLAYSGDKKNIELLGNVSASLVSQSESENLGERMYDAMAYGFRQSFASICLIGSDIYELTPAIIETAFDLLKRHDLVLGPASDGGYYLIGLHRNYIELFTDISWGTDQVLAQTIQRADKLKLSIALLAELNDIDELEDIKEEDRNFLLS